jgi:hypothetical protein
LSNLVNQNGILVLSFWEFNLQKADKEYLPKFYKIEKNDFLLGWKGDFSNHRFCHFFDQDEINAIKEYFTEFTVLDEYSQDDNKYLILKKER